MGEFTEENTSRTVQAMGTTIHYHDVGEGEPIIFLHSWGPGCTAWLTWHKVLPVFAKHYRCIAMDLPNYAKTGPIVHEVKGSVHWFQAEMTIALMDALGIEKAHIVGNSQGGQTAMEFAYLYPDRINKLVWGDGHLNAGAGSYLISNLPEEGIRAGMEYIEDPTRDRLRRFLQLNIEDQSLVTDELVDYCYHMDTGRADIVEARNQIKPSTIPYPDNVNECKNIKAPTLIVWGRNDRTCTFELGIMALNVTPDARLVVMKDTGHWPPFEKPAEYTAHVLTFLKGYDSGLLD
jgi:pimeloyl-ACP methyl ester carboxylesterase